MRMLRYGGIAGALTQKEGEEQRVIVGLGETAVEISVAQAVILWQPV